VSTETWKRWRRRRQLTAERDKGGAGVKALDAIAFALRNLARSIEGLELDIALEFNASPMIKSLPGAVRIAEKAGHPRVGVLFDPAHYHTTPTRSSDINADSVQWIKHVHLDDMPDKPADLTHRDFDRVLPGEGVLDLRKIIATLEEGGYDGFLSIELFNADLWRLPTKEAARRLVYLRPSFEPFQRRASCTGKLVAEG
jgi:2-keto-myo-inositol isomerase